MDFIFMLTRDDKTVADCLGVLEMIKPLKLKHIGFKDLGVDKNTMKTLAGDIRAAGATSYMEVVSTTPEGVRESITTAAEIGADRVLGGQEIEFALDALKESDTQYFPFPGRPVGHPTQLDGSADDIAADCRRMRGAGCAGVDLLAYRATEAPPLDLVRAAREALDDGYLIVAGGVDSPARVRALADSGADSFTIGSAAFNGSFSPGKGSLLSQLQDILDACQAP